MEAKLKEITPLFFQLLTEGLKEAQADVENQDGVFYLDIRRKKDKELMALAEKGLPPGISDVIFSKMLVKDMYYFNKDFTQYSLIPLEGYQNWSGLMNTMYKDFVFNEKLELQSVSAPSINFEHLTSMFIRKDFQTNNEDIKVFEENHQKYGSLYLDEKSTVPQVFFSSLMRSGNSFFRRTVESVFGVCTGSNLSNQITLNFALMAQGLKGESIVDQRTWILKTHYPYMYPFTTPLSGSLALILLRNPLDVIMSLFQMAMTITHNKTMANDIDQEFAEEWDWSIKKYVDLWNKFYGYWLQQASERKTPTHFFRFEDMLTNTKATIYEVSEFLLAQESLEGTYIQKRINDSLESASSSVLYKPRAGGMNSNLKYYSKEQLDYVKENCRDLIIKFGYCQIPGKEANPFSFFEYENITPEEAENWGSYKSINQEQKSWYIGNKAELDKNVVTLNQKGEGIFIAPEDEPLLKFRAQRSRVILKK